MSRLLVITGASRGIGLATAQKFAQEGYIVCNLSRTPCPLPNVVQIDLDLAADDWSGAEGQLASLVSNAEQVTLVHNAGSLIKDSLPAFSAEDFRRVMEINVVAPARLTHLLLPSMRAGSAVIFVGSTLGEMAVPNSCSYVTSKHALIGLMRSACQDFAGTGVHTTCVCPGFTDTEMLRSHVGNSAEVLAAIAGGVAHNRLIEPAEIAETIYFCAQNAVLNGAIIHANLGQINA